MRDTLSCKLRSTKAAKGAGAGTGGGLTPFREVCKERRGEEKKLKKKHSGRNRAVGVWALPR